MKTVMKKLLSVMLVAVLLVSAVPFQASAVEVDRADAKLTVTIFNYQCNQIDEKYFGAGTYTTDELLAVCYPGQYKNYRWMGIGSSITVDEDSNESISLLVDPMETPDEKKVVYLKLVKNDGTSNYETIEMYAGDYILDAIAEAGVKFSREGYTFEGWLTSHTANGADEAQYVVNRYTIAEEDMTIWADWTKITDDDDDNDDVVYDAVLKLYVNGKTSAAAKTLALDAYSKDGKVTRDEVKLLVGKYYKAADSDGMSYQGLFTTSTWNKGNYDLDDAVSSVSLDPDETTYIYVMVKNAKAIDSTTTEPADTTNPKTGDMIFVPMVFMVAAAAAAVLVLNSKKRIVK